jgi:hypothetical protein
MGETTTDDYDAQHGKPGADFTPPPANQEWVTGGPVQDDPLPAKNLKGGGASSTGK